MRYLKRPLVYLFVFIWVFMLSAQNKDGNTLKILSYNIWNGFDFGKDVNRQYELAQWIKAQKPDIVALQELNDFDQKKLLRVAKSWGHDHAEILKIEGYPVGITSNNPIIVKERILESMHHGALHCETYGIDFFVVHFSPFSFKKRHKEADIILAKLEKLKKNQDKYIVLGDFNTLSPFDAHFYKQDKLKIEDARKSDNTKEHVQNLNLGELEYGTMAKFIGAPLIDVVARHTNELEERLSFPTQIWEEEPDNGRYGFPERIDYIMVSPVLGEMCVYARVLNDQSTHYLSDHYPVMAVFSIGN